MKIAVLGTRGFPNVQGGVESHCENLYPYIAAQKECEVVVFARKPYIHLKTPHTYNGIKIIPIDCPKNKFLEAFVHTFKGLIEAKKIKADIVHIHAVGPALLIPLAKLMGLKVVMTNHGPDYKRKKWGLLAKIILQTGEFFGSKFSDRIITIADHIGRDLKKKYNVKATIIPNGVPIKEQLTTDETLKLFDLEKNKYILCVGRFVPEKGLHDLINAFNELNLPDIKLAIVGNADHPTDYSNNLVRLAQQNKQIILTGFLGGKQLQEIYSQARIFVLPSYYEGLPIVLLEAMSYGLSCLISNIDAHKNIKLDQNRFFTPGDIQGIKEKLTNFLNNPLSEKEKIAQIDLIRKDYNWETIAKNTFSVYYSLLT